MSIFSPALTRGREQVVFSSASKQVVGASPIAPAAAPSETVSASSSLIPALAASATAVATAQTIASHRGRVRKSQRHRFNAVTAQAASVASPAAADAGGPREAEVEGLLSWARSRGATLSPKLCIVPPDGPSCLGRGRRVVAQEEVDEGEVIVELPVGAAVSVDLAADAELPKLPDGVALPPAEVEALKTWWSRHTRSSIRIAMLLALDRESFRPYIDVLPELEAIEAPWRWRDEELRFLSEPMAARARARREALESACKDLEAGGLTEWVPTDLFLRAHHAAASRAFSGQVAAVVGAGGAGALVAGSAALAVGASAAAVASGIFDGVEALVAGPASAVVLGAVAASSSRDVLSMLPIIDQVNHTSGPPPALEIDPLKGCWELRAWRRYQVGEEIVFSYGDKDSDSLLLQHGFVEEDNSADALEISIPMDGLSAAARAELEKAGVSRAQFLRGGDLRLLVGDEGDQVAEHSEAVRTEVAAVALDAATSAQAALISEDKVRSGTATTDRAELILLWRRERARVLHEAEERWGVKK